MVSALREDKLFFFYGHAFNSKSRKNFRETFFRGVELIRVEVM